MERMNKKMENDEKMENVTVGWSDFARLNSREGTGQSYSTLPNEQVALMVMENWASRIPGAGEKTLDRKVLVPVPALSFFCPPVVKLTTGMPIRARVAARQGQEGSQEKPQLETWIDAEDALDYDLVETPARSVNIVCYSAEALLENGGSRSTDCECEIVTILATSGEQEPMHPLTMARNFLGEAGGTKSVYTAEEFAEAIWYHSNKGVKVRWICIA